MLLLALTASTASAAVTLDWTVENAFATGCSATGLHCTWLGHVTNPTPFSGANGAVTTSDSATITDPDGNDVLTVNGASPRGADEFFTFTYPAAEGVIDTDSLKGTMEFDGVVSFVAPPPPAGHGFTITVDDPRIVLDGEDGGQLFATGLHTPGAPGSIPVAYDDSAPVWNLDLTHATWNVYADGTRTLSCIVPSIATAEHVFPANYGVGAGPNRTPNIFGSFEIRIAPLDVDPTLAPRPMGGCAPDPEPLPIGPIGPAGPAGTVGPAGPKGADGKTVVTIVRRILVVRLAKAPFGKGAKRRVRVTRKGKLVGKGRVNGRRLRLRLEQGVGASGRLHGRFVLHVIGGKRRAAIRL